MFAEDARPTKLAQLGLSAERQNGTVQSPIFKRAGAGPETGKRYPRAPFRVNFRMPEDGSNTLLRHNGNSGTEARYLLVAGASALWISWTAFHDPSASLRKMVTNRPFSVTAFLLTGSVAVST